MRVVLDRYEARVLIGEIYLPLERLVAYYGKDFLGIGLRRTSVPACPRGRAGKRGRLPYRLHRVGAEAGCR